MLMCVAYDIPDNKTRARVSRILDDYGVRVQKSAYEVDLAEADYSRMVRRLERVIDHRKDAVRIYRLCASCAKRVHVVSGAPVYQRPRAMIVGAPASQDRAADAANAPSTGVVGQTPTKPPAQTRLRP